MAQQTQYRLRNARRPDVSIYRYQLIEHWVQNGLRGTKPKVSDLLSNSDVSLIKICVKQRSLKVSRQSLVIEPKLTI